MERELGRKLLTGQIPVLNPTELPRCPIPPQYVTNFDDYCKAYQEGKLSEAELLSKVAESLKSLKKSDNEGGG